MTNATIVSHLHDAKFFGADGEQTVSPRTVTVYHTVMSTFTIPDDIDIDDLLDPTKSPYGWIKKNVLHIAIFEDDHLASIVLPVTEIQEDIRSENHDDYDIPTKIFVGGKRIPSSTLGSLETNDV